MKHNFLKYLSFLVFLFLGKSLIAQISTNEKPISFGLNLSHQIEVKTLTAPNVDSLKTIDNINNQNKEMPWRFGLGLLVNYNLSNSGTWTTLPNGDKIWRLEITASGALSLNINYALFQLSEGAKFFLFTPDKSTVLGAYTHKNMDADGRFATMPTKGNKIILELYEPKSELGQSDIEINDVVYGYKSIFKKAKEVEKAFGASGSCNINVVCDSSFWAPEARSVVMILTAGNSSFCSGSLVNNTRNDGTPYILTANHCTPATNSIFMFHYQSATCTPSQNGSTNYTMQGCQIKANYAPSDFFLVKLDDTIPLSYNVFYAGWSAINTPAWHSTVIHHPSGDIAKISHDYKPVVSSGYYDTGSTHWEVTSYDTGTTEPGSSGSPLFNAYHRIVGQLHGGLAACGNDGFDYYGKFAYSWNTVADSTQQLKYWLDPINTGKLKIDGYDPNGSNRINDAVALGIIGVSGFSCSPPSNAKLIIGNYGSDTLKNLEITYNIDGQSDSVINWTGHLASFASTAVNLSFSNVSSGYHQISVTVKNPNGSTDENIYNNSASQSYIYNQHSHSILVTLHTDSYGSETKWTVTDGMGSTYVSEEDYPDITGGATYVDTVCLFNNCFNFNLFDKYGDGFDSDYGTGWISVVDMSNNDTLFFDSTFTSSNASTNFCLGTNHCQLLLSATLTRADSTLSNGNITLNVLGGSGNYTYQWSNGDTTQNLHSIPSGNYQVIVHDSSCSDTLTVFLPTTNGIESYKNLADEINIYPNPGKNYFYIKSNASFAMPLYLTEYNLLGQVVMKKVLNKNQEKIATSNLPTGVYLIKISNEKGEYKTLKFIKE